MEGYTWRNERDCIQSKKIQFWIVSGKAEEAQWEMNRTETR